jgi:phosphate transport system protein
MEKHFLTELDSLKNNIIKMATMVDDQVHMAFQALENFDLELCTIVKGTDREVDAYDNLIQTQTEDLLALFQPVAKDLRFIMTAIMVNNQLERCGDIAVNIAQRVKKISNYKELVAESQLLEMGKISRVMVKDAIDSFINRDTNLAKTVIEKDDLVDTLNKKVFKLLAVRMETHPEYVKPGAHLLILSRHIERLADHATNIAEDVVFMVDARLVTHARKFGLQEE